MPSPFPHIDTDIIIRFLTGDDLDKQRAAQTLLARVQRGEVTIMAPDTVIADAVFVLRSPRLYNVSRADVAALLTPLVRLRHFRVRNKRIVLRALELYSASSSGFGDAMILSSMEQNGATEIYSYDAKITRQASTTIRLEP